jgi:peptidoglycan/xylan/chitin deacetylase (PgdA/CDA1 family)
MLNQASLILCFDDGYLSAYTEAFRKMRACNLKGVLFLITNPVRYRWLDLWHKLRYSSVHLSLRQIMEMVDAGWEIGSHSKTHRSFKQLTDQEAGKELKESKTWLEEMLQTQVNSFAYPLGTTCIAHQNLVSRYYLYGRTTHPASTWNGKPGVDIRAYPIWKDKYVDQLSAAMSAARAKNQCSILYFHDIRSSPNNDWDISSEAFNWCIDYIVREDLPVLTFKDFTAAFS